MSASIYWSPKRGKHYLSLGAPSKFRDVLQVFASKSRLELSGDDLPTLEAMIAAAEGETEAALETLHSALCKHSQIVVGIEY